MLGLSVGAFAQDDPAPPAKPAVRVTRDLTLLAAGKYRMVQSWSETGTETDELEGGKPPRVKEIPASNRFTFAVEIGPPTGEPTGPKLVSVLVKRVEMRTILSDEDVSYDSDGPPAKQSEPLVRQFAGLVGKSTRAGAAAFSDGEGFSGLDAMWEAYGKAHPEMSRAAEANLKNYGDARFDRMFTLGLDLLFGPEAGRAKGQVRELRVGEEFTVDAEKPGIAMKPTMVPHACKVLSAAGGTVVLSVGWKINGFDPSTDGGGLVVRGADIHGIAELTFLAQGGLCTRFEETVERTDQTAPGRRRGVAQWTRKVTAKREFSLVKE